MERLTFSQRVEIAEFSQAYAAQRFGIAVNVVVELARPEHDTRLIARLRRAMARAIGRGGRPRTQPAEAAAEWQAVLSRANLG